MNEQDYILVTNRVRVSAALKLVSECNADDDSGDVTGITKGQRLKVVQILHSAEQKMFAKINEMQIS